MVNIILGGLIMDEEKPKKSIKEHLSIVFIPYSLNHVKVLSITYLYGKLAAVFLLVLSTSICIYLVFTISENHGLKQNVTELYSANAQQQKLLDEKTGEIEKFIQKEQAVNQYISSFFKKLNEMTDAYINGKTNRGGERSDATISTGIDDLKSMLGSLNDLYSLTDTVTPDLSSVEAKLNKYLESVPSFWPAEGCLGDTFGYRKDPFTRRTSYHEGLDIAAGYGDDIKAAADGKVILAARYGGYGRAVIIDHGYGVHTLYGHTSKLLVKEGQAVKKGDIIAKVGSSGRSTGAHLHFEVHLYGTPVNPLQYLDEK